MISITTEQMRTVDDLAINKYHITLKQMMELAGFNLAGLARYLSGSNLNNKKIVILAGKGNNGGGGLVSARHMSNLGAEVKIVLSQKKDLKKAVLHQVKILQKMNLIIEYFDEKINLDKIFQNSDLIVDALIGYNLKGNPNGPVSDMIKAVNDSNSLVLSLDVPSGFDSEKDLVSLPCIKADYTMTLALPKKGFFNKDNLKYIGTIYIADIGIPPILFNELNISVGNLFDNYLSITNCRELMV
jgi:NAD(P)H-hydrate epimerase